MKILITGNMGYIGPSVVAELRHTHPRAKIIGFDAGYFAHCLTTAGTLPEIGLDAQIFGDVRRMDNAVFAGVDAVVYLAAISNDPMGNAFGEVTNAINHRAAVDCAHRARAVGARAFVFASSCSVYGYAEEGARDEGSPLDPLTAYARSKVAAEGELAELATRDFLVTNLRFATACGMSPRLRLDLVVNDFVASAIAARKITILSDGHPWRPLIHIRDMARAIDWAIGRNVEAGGQALIVNAGSDAWNYQVRRLAEAVAGVIPGIEVSVNAGAQPDRRSYRVDFALFRRLAPEHQPVHDLQRTIRELRDGLVEIGFQDREFRKSQLIRLNTLTALRASGALSEALFWQLP